MESNLIIEQMHRHRLVAVVRSKSAEAALATARAVAQCGVKFVEITLTIPSAVGVIQELARERGFAVGAGTVLSLEQAKAAISAGASFLVSPGLETSLVPVCRRSGVASIIGAATPTEILSAMRAEADLVKIFPADCLGGPGFIRQILGPFPEARLLVSGGVDRENLEEYVALGVTGICLSSALLDRLFGEGGDVLRREIREWVKLVEETIPNSEK